MEAKFFLKTFIDYSIGLNITLNFIAETRIGTWLYLLDDDKDWHWGNNFNSKFRNWKENQPTRKYGQNCAYVSTTLILIRLIYWSKW